MTTIDDVTNSLKEFDKRFDKAVTREVEIGVSNMLPTGNSNTTYVVPLNGVVYVDHLLKGESATLISLANQVELRLAPLPGDSFSIIRARNCGLILGLYDTANITCLDDDGTLFISTTANLKE